MHAKVTFPVLLLLCSISFCAERLPFLDTVSHLGHLLHYNLCNVQDVDQKLCDMVKKANCVIASFPGIDPFILICLFQSYCLSLYGSNLWILSCTALQNLEVAFNKILRRIWHLPNCSHTGIVHLVAKLYSLFNVVYHRSNSLLRATAKCPSVLVQTIRDSSVTCFSFCGYIAMFATRHLKIYHEQYRECATVVRDLRSCDSWTSNLDSGFIIETISCNY